MREKRRVNATARFRMRNLGANLSATWRTLKSCPIFLKSHKPNVCVCLFFVPYTRLQFWADLHEIWHVASFYPPDGYGCYRGLALCAPSICRCKWVARFVGKFESSGPNAVGAKCNGSSRPESKTTCIFHALRKLTAPESTSAVSDRISFILTLPRLISMVNIIGQSSVDLQRHVICCSGR